MIKAILFDFDGTLLNTNDLIFESYKQAFQKVLKRDITMEEIQKLYGRPLYSSLEVYGEHQEELYQVYRRYNEENHDNLIRFFDGASDGVKMLKKAGYSLAIVTSKRLPTLQRGIDLLGLDGYFDTLITPDDTDKHKPHPMPVLLACERLGVSPSESVMVGDSIFDLESGKSAGAKLAAVTYSTTFDLLCDFKPDFIVDSMVDLAEQLENKQNIIL